MKLTKVSVEKLKPPMAGQKFYRDSELKGFALRVTQAGSKSYVIEKLIGKKVRRITIGRANVLSAEVARKRAQEMLGEIAGGKDPIEEKSITAAKSITLIQCFNAYVDSRKHLKAKTIQDYRMVIERLEKKTGTPLAIADWKNKLLIDITGDMVEKRHRKLGEERGEAWANLSMRVLRALFSFAEGKFEDSKGRPIITNNPVKRLSNTKAWYTVERRQNIIKSGEFKAWYEAVNEIETIGRDYLLTILLTGLRRQEAAKLRWRDIDLQAKILRIKDTKNGREHVLPIPSQLYQLFAERKNKGANDWVFPGHKYNHPIAEPRVFTRIVETKSGVKTNIHDLRRTFATVAESLDIPVYALKRLLNHKDSGDVTGGYIITDVERLRRPIQQIADYLWSIMGVAENNIVAIKDQINA